MAKKKDKKEDLLEEARKRLTRAVESDRYQHELADEFVRFEAGEQWDERSRLDRESDMRPCLVINKCAGVIKQIIGDARQNRPRIKVRPVDKNGDPQIAQIFGGLIKNIENVSDAESAYDWAFECATKGGVGYWRVTTRYTDDDAFDQDIVIDRITNQFSVHLDPNYRKPTGEDAMWAFIVDDMPKEEFEEVYPKCAPVSLDIDSTGYPKTDDETVRIAEYWYKEPATKRIFLLEDGMVVTPKKPNVYEVPGPEGIVKYVHSEEYDTPLLFTRERTAETHKVFWCKLNGAEILEGPEEWGGKHLPIIQSAGEETWVDGERTYRPAIYHARDPQKLYNWSRSLAAETLAMAPRQPFVGTVGAIDGFETDWEMANKKNTGILLYNDGHEAPTRQPGSIPDIGALQEADRASDDIKATTGIYDASLGAKGNETSGRAIVARQREGDTATYIFHDNLAKSIRYTGRILVDLIPKIYDTERVVRLMGEDGNEALATINQAVPGGGIMNDITVGKYDVYVDAGPSHATQRIEAAEGMLQFLQAYPPSASVIGPRLARNLDWPEAFEISEELKQIANSQENPQLQQAQQVIQQLQQGVQQLQQQLQDKDADRQLEMAKRKMDNEAKFTLEQIKQSGNMDRLDAETQAKVLLENIGFTHDQALKILEMRNQGVNT